MIKSLAKAAIGIATLPLDVAADVVTMAGAVTDQDQPYTAKKLAGIMENIDRAVAPGGKED